MEIIIQAFQKGFSYNSFLHRTQSHIWTLFQIDNLWNYFIHTFIVESKFIYSIKFCILPIYWEGWSTYALTKSFFELTMYKNLILALSWLDQLVVLCLRVWIDCKCMVLLINSVFLIQDLLHYFLHLINWFTFLRGALEKLL